MTNKEVINFMDQIRAILLADKSWLESTRESINESFDIAISALEKQIPKETIKPKSPYFKFACPACRSYPLSGNYCGECGQAIIYTKGEK